jgi:glutaredoxin
MRRTTLFSAITLCGIAPAHAGLYKWVDKDGKTIYSDTPPPADIKEVKPRKFGDNVTGPSDGLTFSMRDAMARNPVTLFANACGETCDSAKQLLSGRGIPFTSRDPEKDPAAAEALKKLVGGLQVPTLVVGDNNISGFLDESWHAALTQAGYPRNFTPLAKPTDSPPSARAVKNDETVTPVTPPAPKKKK